MPCCLVNAQDLLTKAESVNEVLEDAPGFVAMRTEEYFQPRSQDLETVHGMVTYLSKIA
jgi:hypothetical protein